MLIMLLTNRFLMLRKQSLWRRGSTGLDLVTTFSIGQFYEAKLQREEHTKLPGRMELLSVFFQTVRYLLIIGVQACSRETHAFSRSTLSSYCCSAIVVWKHKGATCRCDRRYPNSKQHCKQREWRKDRVV